jgi:hypothetical protein
MIETLEGRLLLSATASPTFIMMNWGSHGTKPSATAGVSPIDPAQIQAAYGVNQISFGGTAGTGAGQTIAIVDADNDPDIIANANTFSSQFGLPQFNGSGEPTLKVLNENGGTSLSSVPNASPGGWDVEESLDVEWAHSIAPDANIILFEANSASYSDLLQAVKTAAGTAGVSVVSMSWSGSEFSGETAYDSDFQATGVTYLAATGDSGTPSGYPAFSPNVVAVGGTSLDINSSGTYVSESAWDDQYGAGGGGISQAEAQPSYQVGKVNGTSSTQRTVPDVSMDADPATGVYVLDTDYTSGYLEVGGTSLATPMWAGLVAIANQGRALDGESSLTGYSQTLPALYSLPSSDFHDITSGTNGTYAATAGYDLATGIGSPVANLLVPALADFGASTTPTAPSVSTPSAESLGENSTVVFSTANGDAITLTDAEAGSNSDTLTLTVGDGALTLDSTSGLTVSGNGTSSITVSGTLANLDSGLNGLVYTPTSGFHGSDSLHLSLTDPGDSLTGTGTVALTVNAPTAPTITAPTTTIVVTENSNVVFSSTKGDAITFTDSFAGSNADTLTLIVSEGTLTLGSTTNVTITGNGSSSLTVSGTVANLNSAVNGLTYTPSSNFIGSDSLKISLADAGDSLTGSTSVSLSVTSPTQPPTVTDPSTATVNENSSLTFSSSDKDAIDISDPDATSTSDSLTLTSTHGTLRLATTSGLKVTSGANRSSSLTVTGTLANLNAALNGLIFTPTSRYTGTATITIGVKDSGDGLSGSGSVTVTVARVGRGVEIGGPRRNAEVVNIQTPPVVEHEAGEVTLSAVATDDGIAIRVVSPDATTSSGQTTLAPALPTKPAATGNDTFDFGTATPSSSAAADSTAGSHEASLADDIVQWLGLKAALEFLGG